MSEPATRVLIIGGGYIGGKLADDLAKSGVATTVVTRLPRTTPGPGDWIAADVRNASALERIEGSFHAAVFCAAPADSSDASYSALYVNGLENTCNFLKARNDRFERLIFTSSTGVYDQVDGEWVTEDSLPAPQTFSGRRMLEAEAIVHESGLPSTIVRFAGIYGPERDFLLRKLREKSPFSRTSLERYSNRIYRDDCVGVVKFLLKTKGCGPLYIGVDSDPVRLEEICSWLTNTWDLPPPVVSDTEQDVTARGNKRCSNSRLLDAGYEFIAPSFREGFTPMLKLPR